MQKKKSQLSYSLLYPSTRGLSLRNFLVPNWKFLEKLRGVVNVIWKSGLFGGYDGGKYGEKHLETVGHSNCESLWASGNWKCSLECSHQEVWSRHVEFCDIL